jgi:hypothetical protein
MPLRPALLLPALTLLLQAQPAPAPISPAQRKSVVDTLAAQLKTKYVFPEVAGRVAQAIQTKAAKGGYDAATTSQAFAEVLSQDLRSLGQDLHFRVRFDPEMQPDPDAEDRVPTAAEVAQLRLESAQRGYGILKVERLPGNVGYLELRGFGPTDFVGPAYTAALSLLSGTEALILDLRRNGGGEPESVAYLLSHFFSEGDPRHLNDIYNRPKDTTRQYWTSAVSVHYLRPVYVLTSPRTFSGGEECAYDFQTQKRATLVGEITGGGANPGEMYPLGQGLHVFIPTGRAINPITKTNWEHVGVKPDIAVPAADALKTAHLAILKAAVEKEKDPERRKDLEEIANSVEKGEVKAPNYSRLK